MPAVKVHEFVKFHTEIPGSPTFYTASFFLAMNKAKYDGLPADLKAVIDKNSGMAFAELAGNMWDTEAVKVSEMVKKRGNTITAISAEEKARWVKATEPVHAAWIEQVKGKGLDGAKLIAAAKALVAKYDKAVTVTRTRMETADEHGAKCRLPPERPSPVRRRSSG